jgi:hypothetical protein
MLLSICTWAAPLKALGYDNFHLDTRGIIGMSEPERLGKPRFQVLEIF